MRCGIAFYSRIPMSVLEAHRERVRTLHESMTRLERMHQESYALWGRIVTLEAERAEGTREQLDGLHDEAYALGDRIAQLREKTFGEISNESRLLLTSRVESVPGGTAPPTGVPLGAE